MTEQEKTQRKLLLQLEQDERFKLWRSLIIEEVHGATETQLSDPLSMSEANLKAVVMYRNLVDAMFLKIFGNVASQLVAEKEQEKMRALEE